MIHIETTTHPCHHTHGLGCAVHGLGPCSGTTYLHTLDLDGERLAYASPSADLDSLPIPILARIWLADGCPDQRHPVAFALGEAMTRQVRRHDTTAADATINQWLCEHLDYQRDRAAAGETVTVQDVTQVDADSVIADAESHEREMALP